MLIVVIVAIDYYSGAAITAASSTTMTFILITKSHSVPHGLRTPDLHLAECKKLKALAHPDPGV